MSEPVVRYTERFREYFRRPVAEKAAATLASGVQIELQIAPADPSAPAETFTFTRQDGKNAIVEGAASDPELVFILTPTAADSILTDPSDEIGSIGVHLLKLVVATDANRRVNVRFKAGFLKLWSKGYFGVLKSGGSQFAAQLSSMGLSGMDAIKAALKNLKKG